MNAESLPLPMRCGKRIEITCRLNKASVSQNF